MLTLEKARPEFESNANATGLQQFRMVRRGQDSQGRSVYIYQRTYASGADLGKVFGFEVFIPMVKKAGKYKLPTPEGEEQKWIEYAEDFEEYPGASKFGNNAFFCSNLKRAEHHFDEMTGVKAEAGGITTIPDGEFSTKQLAEANSVHYVMAYQFVKQNLDTGVLKMGTKVRLAVKGKATQLYCKK